MNESIPEPDGVKGSTVIVFIFLLAFGVVCFALYWRSSEVEPLMALWGEEHAIRMRMSRQVKIYSVGESNSASEDLPIFEFAGRSIPTNQVFEPDPEKGIDFLQRLLISDFGYDLPIRTSEELDAEWDFIFQFQSDTGTTHVLYDEESGQVTAMEAKKSAFVKAESNNFFKQYTGNIEKNSKQTSNPANQTPPE